MPNASDCQARGLRLEYGQSLKGGPSGVSKQNNEGDRLFQIAESLAKDFSLFPKVERGESLPGLFTRQQVARRTRRLTRLDIDSYIETVCAAAESKARTPAPTVIRQLGKVRWERSQGPFYSAILELDFGESIRPLGFIAQDRSVGNGVWGPEHHRLAAGELTECARRRIPIVTFMDTPGADAREDANRNNQAHSISRLIAEASNLDVPNVGLIYGLGYSGGAIPLAASNLLLSVRDGLFSTIQPQGLASIAKRLNLSWQECAKYVGLSPFELCMAGCIDGVIDYSPEEPEKFDNLRQAIIGSIRSVEERTKRFVAESPYIMDHYRQSLGRYLHPSKRLQMVQDSALLKVTKNPTEYLNVFGVAYRYLRYLKVRQRIKSTSTQQYGRLAARERELPEGELAQRAEQERRRTFLKWLQDPDKLVYDERLSRAWRSYRDAKQAMHKERGRFAQLLFGEPRRNYRQSRSRLIATAGVFLYNRWKGDAAANLRALRELLEARDDAGHILRPRDIPQPAKLIRALRQDQEWLPALREHFTHEGKKLLRRGALAGKTDAWLGVQVSTELNLLLTGGSLAHLPQREDAQAPLSARAGASVIQRNRLLLQRRYPEHIASPEEGRAPVPFSDMTVLDALLDEDLRRDCIAECGSLLTFDAAYDHLVAHLDVIAEEAQTGQSLSQATLGRLLDAALGATDQRPSAKAQDASGEARLGELRDRFFDWHGRMAKLPKGGEFFRSVEEWKRSSFPHLADALFVVVTCLFQNLLPSFIQAKREDKAYNGRIAPKNIGRRKDFWYRLNMAYRDLLMQKVVRKCRTERPFTHQDVIAAFFDDWQERFGDLMSADPCRFPGFRQAIENALNQGAPPCGIVAGVARFKDGRKGRGRRCGLALSNAAFQAGAFDMASAEKFCRLLVECAERRLPVICFISSGGMQTKEGAGALFSMAAVNDRITRFVRDHDLPLILFGYGDCTGGAQASFVTHPLAQTYYFSGASMPFAGQIVVPSNLPLNAILSNYLSANEKSMQGLVKHPFHPDLDDELRKIDPDIPVPEETVPEAIKRVLSGALIKERPAAAAHRPAYADADLVRPAKRVLIHARGCTAAKLLRVGQKHGLELVLVQSDPDMESAVADGLTDRDTLVCIGGNTPDESYLNARSVLSVAEQEKVDALHPGIGFLSESAQFAELVRSRGINFIGPPVASMETMGNKSNAIATAMRLKVPVVPGSQGVLTDAERAAEVAAEIGYPVLIKAVHGGGGKGIQAVQRPADFHELFHRVAAEARSAFGNGDLYLEKFVTSLRHIEVQLLRDTQGNTRVLGLRDCSVQRDKQKLFEESGSTLLPAKLRKDVLKHSAAIAEAVGYVGAGTVEFIFDLADESVYFMEMNTRLQVEHPVTEWVSGVDIVREQFRIASGESLAALEVREQGYAMEARVNAERAQFDADGKLEFRPHPGEVEECLFPEEQGAETIVAVAKGKFVSPYYDSMVAQIIVHAEDRKAAIAKLSAYLERVRLTGICTNIPLLRRILADQRFRSGDYDTGYLPEFLARTDGASLIQEVEAEAGRSASTLDPDSIRIEGSDELKVLSPATAIFYAAPSPSERDFVAVGDRVGLDATLCQLEAMKVFTPLALKDVNGEANLYDPAAEFEITRINMTSGQQVNAGDLLFVVRPRSPAKAAARV